MVTILGRNGAARHAGSRSLSVIAVDGIADENSIVAGYFDARPALRTAVARLTPFHISFSFPSLTSDPPAV